MTTKFFHLLLHGRIDEVQVSHQFNVKADDPWIKFVEDRMRNFKPYFNIKPAEEETILEVIRILKEEFQD